MNNEKWYPLETSAKIYPAIISPRQPSVYRLSCTLNEEIDPEILQAALNVTIKRFPSFAMTLKRGAFWFYFEELENLPVLRPETLFPCQMIDPDAENGFLFRVTWFRNRINLEVFHVIADGTGGMEFLKSLVFYYLLLSGKDVKPGNNIRTLQQKPTEEEQENSFLRYYDPRIPPDRADSAALHYSGTPLPAGSSRALHIHSKIAPVLELAHESGGTLTEYFTVLFMRSFFAALEGQTDSEKPVKISVPINLRKIFPSDTLRNFTYFANVGQPISTANEPFNTTLASIRSKLREMYKPENLTARINPNVTSEQNLLMRAAPLSIKQLVMRQAHHILGEALFTASYSNLGEIRLDQSVSRHIQGFDFGLGVSDLIPLNLSMISFEGKLSITFSSGIYERTVEQAFARELSRQGLKLEVFSSDPGEKEEGGGHEILS